MNTECSQSKIVVVDDDKGDRLYTKEALENEKYVVFEAMNGHRLYEILQGFSIDLILLDLKLPEENGLSLIPHIRKKTDAPIIIVSGIHNISEKKEGLKSGADDYITKPFYPEELNARIEANLRRYKSTQNSYTQGDISFGPWTLDRKIFDARDEKSVPLDLTVHEYQLLEKLVLANGRTLTREDLRGYNSGRGVDVHITRLRKKFSTPDIIATVRGVGYRLGIPVIYRT